MTLQFRVGTVFRWDNFPDRRYGVKQKARWFIYVGESGYFSQIVVAYICTTTTQKNKFQPGGPRSSHYCFELKTTNTPFDEDCIIDFNEPPYTPNKSQLENNPDISIRGELDENTMRMIYNRLLRSGLPKAILLDIHESYNRTGFTGLKKPK